MTDPRLQELLSGIQRAGEALMRWWPGATTNTDALAIQSKADGTFVSKADLESNEILLSEIKRLFPDDAILSEESPIDSAALARSRRTWVVDPLDGTSSFLYGRDDFSILVALCEDRVPTFGVMLFPARNNLVVAQSGRGAFLNGKPLRVSMSSAPSPGRVYIRNFESRRPELACPMIDSGLALFQVASGELDGAIIRMRTHREWDLAAPIVVLLEAGGKVSDETGAEIPCGIGAISFQYFIASNGRNHKALQAVIP